MLETVQQQFARYERNEEFLHHQKIRLIESKTTEERHIARNSFYDFLKNPEQLAERTNWLLQGHYGYHVMKLCRQKIPKPYHAAELFLIRYIAYYEKDCPNKQYCEAIGLLSTQERRNAILAVIEEIERDFDQSPCTRKKISEEVDKHEGDKSLALKETWKERRQLMESTIRTT